jgi:hypothetical protein
MLASSTSSQYQSSWSARMSIRCVCSGVFRVRVNAVVPLFSKMKDHAYLRGKEARSQLCPFIAWVGSQIRASGKTEQIAAATQVSTVLSGMLRTDTLDSAVDTREPGTGRGLFGRLGEVRKACPTESAPADSVGMCWFAAARDVLIRD